MCVRGATITSSFLAGGDVCVRGATITSSFLAGGDVCVWGDTKLLHKWLKHQ